MALAEQFHAQRQAHIAATDNEYAHEGIRAFWGTDSIADFRRRSAGRRYGEQSGMAAKRRRRHSAAEPQPKELNHGFHGLEPVSVRAALVRAICHPW
jgi:hypothetical protein